MNEHPCPCCPDPTIVIRFGYNRTSTQRYQCTACQRVFTPDPKPVGIAATIRQEAVQLYLTGMSLRKIGKHLGVHHQSVANWVQAAAAALRAPIVDPTPTEVIEMDELYTYVGSKKMKSTSSRRLPAQRG